MNETLLISVLAGWLIITQIIFIAFSPRRAVILAFLLGWMFLPPAGIALPGMPDLTKVSVTSLAVLIGIAFFDPLRYLSFRPRWIDVPMLVYCLAPIASSVSNQLGVYDGLSSAMRQTLLWGVPYFVARLYLTNFAALRELAVLTFVGGLIYMPLCWWEIRMSPNLNYHLYGFGGAGIEYVKELGVLGSRPRVFMGNALACGMFLSAACLSGIWLYSAAGLRRLGQYSTKPLVILLVITALLCKNLGALLILLMGAGVYLGWRNGFKSAALYAMIALPPAYMLIRASGSWAAEPLVTAVAQFHQRRAESLQTRLINEDMLAAKALQRPWFGWGGWGRNRIVNEQGQDITLIDGIWVNALGINGVIGLAALTLALLGPPLLFVRRYPAAAWGDPDITVGALLATLVVMSMVDNLFNGFPNPAFLLAAGGLVCVAASQPRDIAARIMQSRRTGAAAAYGWQVAP
ncbi:hypothetical protein RAS1_04610 [Phycisphaerae bacterium RAS1]|nr:hypothetical protein RAS1_04610 [Phycisphaerae bacterium RAS1]